MDLTDIFSNRELAVGAWALLLAGWIVAKRKMRASLGGLARSALAWKLSVPAALLAAYTSFVCYLLWRVGFWEAAMLKDTILWFIASGLVLAYSFNRSSQRGWFRSALRDQLGVLVLIEYLAAAYTFSLPAELALQPFLIGVGLLHGVSESDAKYRPVTQLTAAVMIVAGLLIVGNAAYQAAHAIDLSLSTAKSIGLPVLLAIAFLPAAYCLHLIVAYENLFLRLRLGEPRDRAIVRYAKRQLFKMLRFSVRRVNRFLEADPMALVRVRSKQDVDELLRHYRRAPAEAS
jgi:hypothetical protein